MTEHRGWHSRGYLPHLDTPGVVQTVTFHLADSLPAEIMARPDAEKDVAKRRLVLDLALDSGHGSCLLAQDEAAEVVEKCLLAQDGTDYRLLAWVIMPNHVHVVVELSLPLPMVVQAWKSVTARRINALRRRGGRVWQPDYFDRYVRDDSHLMAAIRYAEDNPVKAGLCLEAWEWRWSSAARRAGEGARAPSNGSAWAGEGARPPYGDLALCPLCGRPMVPGPSLDHHHWVPKSEGGRVSELIHKLCHRVLHARFSEKELAAEFSTPEAARADPEMARFIAWVRKRPPEYLDWPKDVRKRR